MRMTSTGAPHRKQRRAVAKAAALALGVGTATVAITGLPTASAAVTTSTVTPASTSVGAVDGVTITVSSSGGDNISQINYLPSCGGTVATPLSGAGCATSDPGIFAIALAPGSSCTGVSLGSPLANGMIPITINPPFGTASSCFVNLTRTAIKLGATDVSAAPGFQTQGAASVINNGVEGSLSAVDVTTIDPGPTPPPPPTPPAGPTCHGLPATIVKGSGNDTVVGTSGNDVVILGSGNDTFVGNGGSDTVCAGSGNDVIDLSGSGAGDVTYVDGASGNDTITTGDSDDTILGGSGNDVINHGGGTDTIDAGSGANTVNP